MSDTAPVGRWELRTIYVHDGQGEPYGTEERWFWIKACRPKTGWITGATYCEKHGRKAGWPCSVGWLPKQEHLSPQACSRCNPLDCACECHKETRHVA